MKDSKVIKRKVIFHKYSKRFVKETLLTKDRKKIDWYFLDSPRSTIIVPITGGNKLVLVRQYRYNLKKYTYEFPAGFFKNPDETSFLSAAKIELLEETGYQAGELIDLGKYYILPSETNRWTKIYLALDVVKIKRPKLDNLIEKYFDITVVLKDYGDAVESLGKRKFLIEGLEHRFALMLAQKYLSAPKKI